MKKIYKTELHCHSKDVSTCADESAEGIVEKYLRYGYNTVLLTNHLSLNCHSTEFFKDFTWEQKVDHFVNGYRKLKKAAEGTSLNILFGAEIRFPQYFNDYLLIGLTEEYLLSHENLYCTDVASFHKMSSADGLLLIQAHPFRPNLHIVDPEDVDGYEVYNGHPGWNSANDGAFRYAKNVGAKIITSGTDHHDTVHFPTGGIITSYEIKTMEQLMKTLKNGSYALIKEEEIRLGHKRL